MSGLFMLLAGLAAVSGHIAQSDARFRSCGDEDRISSIHEAIVETAAPIHLMAFNDDSCGRGKFSCKKSSWVRAGAKVLILGHEGTYSCALYMQGFSSRIYGYLPDADLKAVDFTPNATSWVGTWRTYGTQFDIALRNGELKVAGQATRGPPSDDMALTDGQGDPTKGMTSFIDKDSNGCHIKMRLIDIFLVVENEDECGGNGVTFSGIFVKSHHRIEVV